MDNEPIGRQYVTVKFKEAEKRAYTFHNDGEPLKPGDEVKLPSRGSKDPDAWSRGYVATVNVEKPSAFETKGVMGLAPPKYRSLAGDGDDADAPEAQG